MRRYILSSIPLLMVFFVPVGQSQQFVEPKMEVHNFFGMEPEQFMEGIFGRDVALNTIKFARIDIEEGRSTPHHNHPDEQFVLVLEGRVRATSGENEFIVNPGELIAIPAYVEHTYTALEDSICIEIFGPGRPF